MPTIMRHEELLRRALAFLLAARGERPGVSMTSLLDEAGMRFNLSPADAESLERLFREAADADGQA